MFCTGRRYSEIHNLDVRETSERDQVIKAQEAEIAKLRASFMQGPPRVRHMNGGLKPFGARVSESLGNLHRRLDARQYLDFKIHTNVYCMQKCSATIVPQALLRSDTASM